MKKPFKNSEIFIKNVPRMREILAKKTVGIAGCGGLGSNIAIALTRAGIGKLILVDMDVVEPSNLNRQYYFLKDVGKKKNQALASHLLNINSELAIESHFLKLSPKNILKIYGEADLLMEAFDAAESKAWLIETWSTSFPGKPIVCGSGVAGYGNSEAIKVNRMGNLIICGDFQSDLSMGLSSARVAIVANMQANEAIECLMKG